MSTSTPEKFVAPIVNVITVTQPESSDYSETVSPSQRQGERRIARGFTITIRAPPDEDSLNDSASLSHQGSLGSNIEDIGLRPRDKSWERDYLTPDEFMPDVPLDRTESRLPSLEDMIADEEIKKMLGTSDIHRAVQEAIVIESDALRYDSLMSLVQKSYEDAEWRKEAAKDKQLTDTLILYIRQRITEAQNPLQRAGGDFMGRSTRTLQSLTSRSFGRSNTPTSEPGIHGSNCLPHLASLSDAEQIHRAAVALALAGPVLKLLRNFCVENKDCQLYLHDHRALDFLFDHIDLISEITYQAAQGEDSTDEPAQMLTITRRCPPWAASELLGFPRSLVQLVTNVVSGNPNVQAHVLSHIFPEALVKIIVLSADADLLSCLLHCLTVQQPTSKIYELLIADPRSVQIWYLLLSAALRQAEPAVESVAYRRQETKPLVQDSSKGEWLSLFISSILKREFENRSFFVEMVNTLLASDPLSFQNLIPKLVLSHVAPSRSPSRTTSSSRRSSYESEWMSHVHFQVDKVLVLSKQDVMLFFFTLIEALLDGELSQQPIRLNGLIGSFVTSTETLAFLIRYFETSVAAIENPDLKDMENLTYRQSFVPLVQILVSMTAVSYLSDTREKFNQILGTPLLIQVIRLLKICHEMQSTKDFKWSILEASLSRRDLLMVIANLCYKSLENQKRLGIEEGISVLLNHAHMEINDPLMEQAAIFALRNATKNEQNQKIFKRLLSGESRRIHLTENVYKPDETAVIGRFDVGEKKVIKIDQISLHGHTS